jgi:hypothetical protein
MDKSSVDCVAWEDQSGTNNLPQAFGAPGLPVRCTFWARLMCWPPPSPLRLSLWSKEEAEAQEMWLTLGQLTR